MHEPPDGQISTSGTLGQRPFKVANPQLTEAAPRRLSSTGLSANLKVAYWLAQIGSSGKISKASTACRWAFAGCLSSLSGVARNEEKVAVMVSICCSTVCSAL